MGKKESAAQKAKRLEHEEALEQAQHMRQLAEEKGGAGGTATIFRLDAGDANDEEAYLETVGTAMVWDDPHAYLDQKWGGGYYRIVLKDSDKQFIAGMSHLKYRLAGPRKEPTVETAETRRLDLLQEQLDEAMKGGGGQLSSADMMRFMMEISREQLREVRNPPAAAAMGNPAEMAVNLVAAIQTAQKPLLEGLIERASQPAPDTMAQLKGMVEMFTMMRELTGEGTRGGWDSIASKLADPLVGLLGQHVANQKNGTAPPSTMGAAALPAPDASMAPRPPWYAFLEPYLPQLLNFAASGRDPITTADFLADGTEEEHFRLIYEQLSKPTFMDELRAHVPETAQNPEWFAAFAARVLEWVVPPEESKPVAAVEPSGWTALQEIADEVETAVQEITDEVGTVASPEATE